MAEPAPAVASTKLPTLPFTVTKTFPPFAAGAVVRLVVSVRATALAPVWVKTSSPVLRVSLRLARTNTLPVTLPLISALAPSVPVPLPVPATLRLPPIVPPLIVAVAVPIATR